MVSIKKILRKIKHQIIVAGYKISSAAWNTLYRFPKLLNCFIRLNKRCFLCRIESIYDYCTEHNGIVQVFDEAVTAHIRKETDDIAQFEHGNEQEEVPAFKVYLGKVNNAGIIGHTDFILCDKQYMTDRLKWDPDGIYRFNPHCVKIMDKDVSIVKPHKMCKNSIERGIFLLGRWTENYYHLSVDIISRLQYVDKFEQYREYPLLLDKIVFNDSRSMDLVNLINIHKHPIIKIKSGVMYTVKDLIYPAIHSWSFLNYKGRGTTCAGATHAMALEYLRQCAISEDTTANEKIYVSRGNNYRLVNEYEIASYLEGNGFKVVNTDEMTLAEEIKCFNSAKIIVGVIGAAFTNVIYCNRNAHVYQICPIEYQLTGAHTLADLLKIHFEYLNAEIHTNGKSVHNSRFYLPIDKCKQLVDTIMEE